MPLNVGIDLCDEYITAYSLEDRRMLSVPTMVCRKKKEDLWYIGEEAYRVALSGEGVLTDKLLSLLKKNGASTIQRKTYSALHLLSKLIRTLLLQIFNTQELPKVDKVVISLRSPKREDMDVVCLAAVQAGLDRDSVYVISHEEAFVQYMLSMDRELIFNMAGLFDLSGETLSFYRMKVVRGAGKASIVADSRDLEEAFRIGIIKNESGSEIGDRLLTTAARKYLGNDIYSSVLLTGKGFESTAWAGNFIDFICKKRRVIYEGGLFAIGAALAASELAQRKESAYFIFCDTRTQHSIFLNVTINDVKTKLVMVQPGSRWYDLDTFVEMLPRGQNYVDLEIDPVEGHKQKSTVRIGLEGFPKRPDRCTRVSLEIKYLDFSTLWVEIKDLGFGDIYPSSGKSVSRTLKLFEL